MVIFNPDTAEGPFSFDEVSPRLERRLLEEQQDIISEDLVPGDIILIRGSTTMQCDAALLNGNVIVNESMLTGESIPVTKVQIPYHQASSDHPALTQPFDVHEHNRFILFSGTSIIQTRYYGAGDVRAVVLRTGLTGWSSADRLNDRRVLFSFQYRQR